MGRRKKSVEPVIADGVPGEFMSVDDPVWASEDATRAWFAEHGLVPSERVRFGPINRLEAAMRAWTLDAYGPGLWRRPQLGRLWAAGVPKVSGNTTVEEFKFRRVRFE